MSYEIHGEEELERWEREHDFKIRWACPRCGFEYEDRPGTNESLECPNCQGVRCVKIGESYAS